MTTEALICDKCGLTWVREIASGRKPKICPDCIGREAEPPVEAKLPEFEWLTCPDCGRRWERKVQRGYKPKCFECRAEALRRDAEMRERMRRERRETVVPVAKFSAPPQPVLAVAHALLEAQQNLENATAQINHAASLLADTLAEGDEPWSTDEPLQDLSALWETSRAVRRYPRLDRRRGDLPSNYTWPALFH